ncbi:MAG: biotin/lipoyl-binding protein, partial [Planctomycetales bacterium]|nr:biotin/lipoyl-binding protein [Planctomycetales bacterium]
MTAVVWIVGCWGCAQSHSPRTELEISDTRTVETVEVIATPIAETVTLVGRTEPWREATLYFEVGGVVAEVLVDPGATVRKGQAIARLELKDFELAVARAQAELDAAVANFQLLETGT